jgi:hypothetical protein
VISGAWGRSNLVVERLKLEELGKALHLHIVRGLILYRVLEGRGPETLILLLERVLKLGL